MNKEMNGYSMEISSNSYRIDHQHWIIFEKDIPWLEYFICHGITSSDGNLN